MSGTAYAALLPTIWSLINSNSASASSGCGSRSSHAQSTFGKAGSSSAGASFHDRLARAKAKTDTSDRMETDEAFDNTDAVENDDLPLASRVLGATLEHATQTGSLSAVKQIATEFVGRLYLVRSIPSCFLFSIFVFSFMRCLEWNMCGERECGERDMRKWPPPHARVHAHAREHSHSCSRFAPVPRPRPSYDASRQDNAETRPDSCAPSKTVTPSAERDVGEDAEVLDQISMQTIESSPR